MSQGSRFRAISMVPFLALLAGLSLSTWQFRAGDSVGGLAFGLGGMLLMLVLAIRLDNVE